VSLFRPVGSKVWYANYLHPVTGKRVRKTTKTTKRAEAQAVLDGFLGEAKKTAERREQVTLKEAIKLYVDSLEAAQKPSSKEMRALGDRLVGEGVTRCERATLDGSRFIHTLAPIDMEEFVSGRRADGKSAQTIAHEIKLVRAACRYVAGLGMAGPSQMYDRSLDRPWRIPATTQKTRYLGVDEWQMLFDYLDPDKPVPMVSRSGTAYERAPQELLRERRQTARDLLVALTLTGGRWSEVASLTWDRVNPPEFNTIRLWGNKTSKERLVPVPDMVREVLQRRFARRTSAVIFPALDGGALRRTKILYRAIDECGLNSPEKVAAHGRATIHSLRHTFASWLLQGDAELSEVQDALGHTSIHMTRRYAHLSKHKTAAKLGGILNAIVPDDRSPGNTSGMPKDNSDEIDV